MHLGFVCVSCSLSAFFPCPHPLRMNEILRPFINKALSGLSKQMDPEVSKSGITCWIEFISIG